MKTFIDRFSDLLGSQNPLGRQLRGRRFALLSTGSDPSPDRALNLAFDPFCSYLGIENLGAVYACQSGPFVNAEVASQIRLGMASSA